MSRIPLFLLFNRNVLFGYFAKPVYSCYICNLIDYYTDK